MRLTYAELVDAVLRLRASLYGLGVRRGDRVALLSYNRPEWIIADLAVQSLGAVDVPIYHTLPASQVDYYLRDSGASIIVTEDARQTAKLGVSANRSPTLNHIVQIADDTASGVTPFATLVEDGPLDAKIQATLDAIEAEVSPDDVATFIYTSGTTGMPKSAMLSHRALLYTSEAATQMAGICETDVFLSFLPLCHVVERVGGYYLPMSIGGEIVISEGPFALSAEMREAAPTAFICVPRVFDAIRDRVVDTVAKLPHARRAAARWALAVGTDRARRIQAGRRSGPIGGLLYALADALALRRIRVTATGGSMRYLVSGGAPLDPETGLFMAAIGVEVLEGYGLTEFPVISLNRPGDARFGTVGPPIPGVGVRIAADGEVLARGPSLMRGYYGRDSANDQTVDAERWLHTGDVGELDATGRLTITDRIKDIIVLANGKNVAPQPIETLLRQSPFVSEAVLFGDGQNSLVALIVPAFDHIRADRRRTGLPPAATGDEELARDPEVRRLMKAELDRLSSGLADFEHVKQFRLIPRPFSIENDELTPTMKVKRRSVARTYAADIAAMLRH